MGLFDKMNEKADAKMLEFVKTLLLPEEEISHFIRTVNDFIALTNKRLILCDYDFEWGDSKTALFTVPVKNVTAVSMINPLFGLRKFKVGVHVGSLTIKLTFFKEEDAKKCWMLLNGLIC